MNDMEILRKAYDRENDPRDRRPPQHRNWEAGTIGASQIDVKRLVEEGLLNIAVRPSNGPTRYKLTEKGRNLVWATNMEREFAKIPAATILEAMDLVIGYQDLKETIAQAVEARRRINFLLEGPPACAKSIMLEAVRSAVPDAYTAFGSRTSASGLSDALFEHQPSVLLMDEADKMHNDCYSVLLGLMETGEILETKSKKTRGIVLQTMVIAACNGSEKMPREFLSRFALHACFPHYTREEFIDVCRGFLSRAESCPEDIAEKIGQTVYDRELGDVRKARSVWQLMRKPEDEEIERVVQLMIKYGLDNTTRPPRKKEAARLPGI
jgi:hypothetical protein